jgi:hypothetical protein
MLRTLTAHGRYRSASANTDFIAGSKKKKCKNRNKLRNGSRESDEAEESNTRQGSKEANMARSDRGPATGVTLKNLYLYIYIYIYITDMNVWHQRNIFMASMEARTAARCPSTLVQSEPGERTNHSVNKF